MTYFPKNPFNLNTEGHRLPQGGEEYLSSRYKKNSHYDCPIDIRFSTAMIILTLTAIAVLVGSLVVEQVQCARTVKKDEANNQTIETLASVFGSLINGVPPNCFPAVGFNMPDETPTDLTDWWCNTDTEYAFVGFSYDISLCEFFTRSIIFIYMTLTGISFSGPRLRQLKTDFTNMRKTFNTRYVRLYGACDNEEF